MGVDDRFVLPRLLALDMRNKEHVQFLERTGRAAQGRVLEIGIRSVRDLLFRGQNVRGVVGIDPSPAMADARCVSTPFPVELPERGSEQLPLDGASVETVVTTWTRCNVGGPPQTLREVRRVLPPGCKLLFVEDRGAADASVRSWQDRLTPHGRASAGGCHLDRKADALVLAAGLRMDSPELAICAGRGR